MYKNWIRKNACPEADDEIFEKLIEEDKIPTRLMWQIDCWLPEYADVEYIDSRWPDEDGYGYSETIGNQERSSDADIRVQILGGTTKQEALKLLDKMKEEIERNFDETVDYVEHWDEYLPVFY